MEHNWANHTVKIKKAKLLPILSCNICGELLENPTAIDECLHLFCRKCIYDKINEEDLEHCPVCNIHLGPEPRDRLRWYHVCNNRYVGFKVHQNKEIKVVSYCLCSGHCIYHQHPVVGAEVCSQEDGLDPLSSMASIKATDNVRVDPIPDFEVPLNSSEVVLGSPYQPPLNIDALSLRGAISEDEFELVVDLSKHFTEKQILKEINKGWEAR